MREKGESAFDDVVNNDSGDDGGDRSDADSEPAKDTGQTSTTSDTTSTTTTEGSAPSGEEGETTDSVAESVPGFPFSEVDQQPVYMREDTWNQLEDAKFYAEKVLREQYDVRNVETREFDEAIAQLVIEELPPEALAAKIVEVRGFDP